MPIDIRTGTDADHGWSLLEAALEDDRLTASDFRALVKMAVAIYAPPVAPDAKRAHANRTWLDAIVQSRGTRSGEPPRDKQTLSAPPPVRATPEKILAAAAKARGETAVVDLPAPGTLRARCSKLTRKPELNRRLEVSYD